MPTQQKKDKVEELKQKFSQASSVVFAEYKGLNANLLNELRKEIRAENAELTVAKNSLMGIALNKKELEGQLEGQILTLFSYGDAITPLKKLFEFAKKYEVPAIKMGIFAGVITTVAKLEELSNLPSREVLLGQFVEALKSPLAGIVNVLGATQRNFVYALSAIADKKEV